MKNFNSFNAQPEYLGAEKNMFGDLTYDKAGTSLDNIVGELRRHDETTFVATANAYGKTLQERLYGDGTVSNPQGPISSILKLDNNSYIVTHAGFSGLVKTNKENGEARLVKLMDMSTMGEDFNPYEGYTIGQLTKKGNTPLALTVFNRGTRSQEIVGNNPEYQKFQEGLSRQIIAYYENME